MVPFSLPLPVRVAVVEAIITSPKPHSTATSDQSTKRGIMASPDFQGGNGEEGEQRGDDPEADDDLGFRPPLHLEVVMDRRAQEDALAAAQAEAGDLQGDRQGFEDEDETHYQHQE